MSLIARPRVNSADTDTTDTDDGDAMVSAGDFWPAISLHEIRLASRIPGRTTTTRLLHAATEAVAHVIAELELWKRERMAEGAASLADVPATQVNGESVHVHRYRRAVFASPARLYWSAPGMWIPPIKATAGLTRWTCRLRICGGMPAGQYQTYAVSPAFMRSWSDESNGSGR